MKIYQLAFGNKDISPKYFNSYIATESYLSQLTKEEEAHLISGYVSTCVWGNSGELIPTEKGEYQSF